MQILDRKPASRALIASAQNAELAIQLWKAHLPHVGTAAPQRTFSSLLRQLLPETLHHAEDSLGSFASLRHLHGQHAASRNGLQKQPRRNPGRHAHLPRLQNDIPSSAPFFEGALHRIRCEGPYHSISIAHLQVLFNCIDHPLRVGVDLQSQLQQSIYIPCHLHLPFLLFALCHTGGGQNSSALTAVFRRCYISQ